jgi:hypothetical protein
MLPERVIRRLGALGDLSRAGKRVNGLFRLLESPVVWMEAYANIYANKGATTRGVTPNTLDGCTDERVVNLQTLLRENRYHPHAVRRVYIPKRAALSTWSSLCQELGSRAVLSVLICSARRGLLLGTTRMFLISRQVHR